MKVKSEVDLWFQLIVGSTIILMISASFLIPENERWVMFIITIPSALFLLSLLFNTWYILEEDHLICVSGPFREKIYYDKIKEVKLTENMLSSMALSRRRIEIRQHNKNYFVGTTMISPQNREDFYVALRRKCKNLLK
ncbi:MAG: hypothetical protein CVU94_07405 [Firmicutes bacterium HGW-Firmicutes-19]|jgi:uncharacterized membrane protein YobD (UPF0266 family)|nr:MAG: hypothetical protein CVU94_07405 [Firmicutes bacterium HGW-Firmicutes-19]